jgi:hypothetical protein
MGMKLADIAKFGPAARRQIALDLLEQARQTAARENALTQQAPAPRRSKYGNVPTEAFGHKFASQIEAEHYVSLRSAERRGEIRGLIVHPRYRLEISGVTVCHYIADFEFSNKRGELVVQDVKGVETPVFRLKRKLMKVLLGIDVKVIRKGDDAGYD